MARQFSTALAGLFLFGATAPGQDVKLYAVLKGRSLVQTNGGNAVPDGASPFLFQVFVNTAEEGSVSHVTLTTPLPASLPLATEGSDFAYEDKFASTGALHAAYPDGLYHLVFATAHDGTRTNAVALTNGTFPPSPHFSNFSGMQAVNPSNDFSIVWDPIPGATENDFLQVEVRDCDDNEVLTTGGPREAGALHATATSVLLHARSLRPGQTYRVELLAARASTWETNAYPGALGIGAYLVRVRADLKTTGTVTDCPFGHFELFFNFPPGSFGRGLEAQPRFPTGLSNYFAVFSVWNDSNSPASVTFTGPPGSGLSNTSNSYPGYGWYASPPQPVPPSPPGGVWTVNYRGSNYSHSLLPPLALAQQVLLVPGVVTNASGQVTEIHWSYKDTAGAPLAAQSFMKDVQLWVNGATNRIYQVGNNGDAISPATNRHSVDPPFAWSDVASMEISFRDVAGNSFISLWSRGPDELRLTTPSVPDGTLSNSYAHTFQAEGGVEPYAWSLFAGALPPGLLLHEVTGELAGSPALAGEFSFTVRVTDALQVVTDHAYALRIFEPGTQPMLTNITVSPPAATNLVGETRDFEVVGRFDDGSARVLDAGLGTWAPLPALDSATRGLGAVCLGARLYAIAGEPVNWVMSFGHATGTWASNTPLPAARSYFGLATVSNKVYVIGGDTQLGMWASNVFVFDPVSDAWSNGPAAMPGGQRAGMGAAVLDGKIYVVGGFSDDYLRRVEVYDPAAGSWATRAPMLTQRFSPAVGAIGGLLYVAGGGNGPGAERSMEIYDPTNNTWTAGPDLPEPHTGPGVVLRGRLYVIGGGPSPTNKVYVFDPAWNAWTQLAPMTEARDDVALAADEAGGRIFAVAGYNRRYLKTVEVFTPPEVLWSSADQGVAVIGPSGRALATGPGATLLTAFAGPWSASTRLSVLTAPNQAPVISDILNQTTRRGQPTPPIPFVVGDAETPAADLLLAGTSSDALLVAATNITFAGAGADRTLTVRPTPGRSGTTVITVTVSDGAATARDQFELRVSGGADVEFYTITKSQRSVQTNAGALVADGTNAFGFETYVREAGLGFITNGSVTPPAGVTRALARIPGEGAWGHERTFSSLSNLEAAFPAGTYTLVTAGVNDGRRTNRLEFPAGTLPAAPRVTSWDAVQNVEASLAFSLPWNALAGGTSNDFVQVKIESTNGGFEFASPDWRQAGALDGRSNSFVIPGGTLQDGTRYRGEIGIYRPLTLNTNSYPGVPGVAALAQRTRFALVTLPAAPSAGRVRFAGPGFSGSEAGTNAYFTVTRSGGSNGAVMVDFATVDGTARADLDYLAAAGPLTLEDGETAATFYFPLLDDRILEGNETVKLTVRNPSGGAVLGWPSNATFLITDDEVLTPAGLLQFSAPVYTVSETGLLASVTVVRAGGSTGTVAVTLATTNGTALDGLDYTGTNVVLTFNPGVTNRTFRIAILDNTRDEPNKTLGLRLDQPTAGAVLGPRNQATLTIVDDDVGGVIQFDATIYKAAESNGVATISLARTGGLASAVSVDFLTRDRSASNGVDYLGTNGTLLFEAGQSNASFTVPLRDNATAEGDRSLALALTNATGGGVIGVRSNATLTLLDDEVGVQFAQTAWTAGEMATGAVVTVVRTGPTNAMVGVDLLVTNGTATAGADYVSRLVTLTLPAGVRRQTSVVTLLPDTVVEGDETVALELSNPTGALLGRLTHATLTVVDDDFGGVLNFQRTSFSVSETGRLATIAVVRTNGLASGVTVTFATTTNGSARPDLDFTPTNGILDFSAGITSRTFQVAILDNAFDETNRNVGLTISNPGGGSALGLRTNATLTINDNDLGGTLALSATNYSVAENATQAVLTVVRTGGAADGVSVDFFTRDGSALAGTNYVGTNGTITFAAGQFSNTLVVPLIDNEVPDGPRTFSIALTNPAGGAVLGAVRSAPVLIRDDEVGVQFRSPTFSVSETSAVVTITVVRTGPATSQFSVDYATSDDTATAGSDYAARSGTLTFSNGVTSRSFTIPLTNDTRFEGDETIRLALFNPTGAAQLAAWSNAVLTIVDDDRGGVLRFAATNYMARESNAAVSITVTRRGGLASGVTVNVGTSEGSALSGTDYVGTNVVLAFGAGISNRNLSVRLLDNATPQTNRVFQLFLSGPSGGATLESPTNAIVTIQDDDP